jgi:hypothetical protein
MTEQQREEELLSELLDLPENADQRQTDYGATAQPLLTRREEQALLRAANQVGTPTLAPDDSERDRDAAPHSFVSDLAGVARKYPVLAVLAAGGIAFLLARRRR